MISTVKQYIRRTDLTAGELEVATAAALNFKGDVMQTKQTVEQILARIKAVESDDWMGVMQSDLIEHLPFEHAKPFLKDGVTQEQWDAREVKAPLDEARAYLDFAWEKANDCRGLSAGRSLNHLSAWLWLAGFGDVVDQHFSEYTRYGKKQLVIASVLCGFDWTKVDNGKWVNSEEAPSFSPVEIDSIVTVAEGIARTALAAAGAA